MTASPLVSIAIPAYKALYLEQALASVGSQKYGNIELVVCDDSNDGEIEQIVRSFDFAFPVHYYRNDDNMGTRANHEKCVRLAQGKYLKFLHDDDVLDPYCVEKLVAVLETRPDVSMVSSKRKLIDSRGNVLPDIPATAFPFDGDVVIEGMSLLTFLGDHTVNFVGEPSCVLCRRDDLLALGDQLMSLNGLPIRWLADLAMYANLFSQGDLAFLKEPLCSFRVSLEQSSQAGRDQPGVGNQGHADFRRTVRELGWYDASRDSRHVRVARLMGFGSDKFIEFNLIEGLNRAFHTKPARLSSWLGARAIDESQRKRIKLHLAEVADEDRVLVIVLDRETDQELVKRTLSTITEAEFSDNLDVRLLSPKPELYGDWPLQAVAWSADDSLVELNALLAASAATWFLLVEAGAAFTPSGLLMARLELSAKPNCRAIFFDEMYRQADGQLGAAFRPSFNLDYLISFPAGMARHWLFNRLAALEVGGFDIEFGQAAELDLILRLISQGGLSGLGHIAEPLVVTEPPVLANIEDERASIIRHLQQRGYPDAKLFARMPGRYHIDYGHPAQPLVSVLIAADGDLARLQRCIESFLDTTSYPFFELLLIETASDAPGVKDWLAAIEGLGEARLKVLDRPSTTERLSTSFNRAANLATGDYLLLLSADTAVVNGAWLNEMLNHAQRPEVGAVGAKLLSGDGKIARASMLLGLNGPVGSPFVGDPMDDPGYMQRLQVDQNCSAVSRDCCMMPRELYLQLGGFAEEQIPDCYLDLDLALRIAAAGYLIVWSPEVQLMLDRPVASLPTIAEQDAIYAKWLPQLARDPAYSPNLSLAQPGGFKLADSALSWRPLDTFRPMPVVLAHPADMHGCGHYRVIQPFNAMREAGLVDGALSQGLMHVTDLERYAPDVVVLQRQIGDERLEAMRRMKAFSNAFKVYELDDYLPNLPLKSAHRNAMPKDIVRSLRRGLSFVDRFVVSTEPLAEAFAGFHDDIRVVENRLDPRWWASLPASARGVSGKPRVGWAGGASHTGDLELILDVVKELAGEVEWVFFGMCPDKLRPYMHEFHQGVPIDQYPRMLASLSLDLALAPVEENLFNECKSNLRLLEYGACGYPVVCSDVRCYAGALPVTRVKNRYRDWVDAIRMHLSDPAASQAQGQALHEAVKKDWMLRGDGLEAWRQGWLS